MTDSMPNIIMIANLLIYNLGIFVLLRYTLKTVDLKQTLAEKPQGAAPVAGAPQEPASYSRVSGFVGSIVLAVFFWALGNVILYKALGTAANIAEISTIVASLGTFFLAGAALFLPYAFNQLKGIF